MACAWSRPGRALQAIPAQYQSPQRIEINLQAVRWPAVTPGDMGGHAEYLLRIFGVTGHGQRRGRVRP